MALLRLHRLISAFILLSCLDLRAEDYKNRPDILSPQVNSVDYAAQIMQEIPSWEKFKKGSANYIPFIYAMYPDSRVYFLARDGEYLYDVARALTLDDEALATKTDLVPINSAISSSHANYKEYLTQLGFDQMLTSPKEQVVFIDTCCSGTIPTRIKTSYANHPGKIQWHFIDGGGTYTPSSQLFYEPSDGFEKRDGIGVTIEGYPHYHTAITSMIPAGPKIIAEAAVSDADTVQKVNRMLSDLKHTFDNPAARQIFKEKVKHIGVVLDFLQDKPASATEVQKSLEFLQQHHMKSLAEDVRNAVATTQTSRPFNAVKVASLKDFFSLNAPLSIDGATIYATKEAPQTQEVAKTPEAPKPAIPGLEPVVQTHTPGIPGLDPIPAHVPGFSDALMGGDSFTLPGFPGVFHYAGKASGWKDLSAHKISDHQGNNYILYRADDPEAAKDLKRFKDYWSALNQKSLPIPPATNGTDFVAIMQADGGTGEQFLKQMEAGQTVDQHQRFPKMLQLFEQLLSEKIYLEIEPKDLTWNGQQWLIARPVKVHEKSSVSHLKKKYRKLIREEWTKKNSNCYNVFSPLWEP